MATPAKKKTSAAVQKGENTTPEIDALSAAPSKKEAKSKAPAKSSSPKAVSKPRSKKKETEGLLFGDERPSTGQFTHSEIAIRAYFISEERGKTGRHGDSHSDWLEAERQLAEELGR